MTTNRNRYNQNRDNGILIVVLIILMYVLGSCSAEWHLNRAVQKDPNVFKAETVTVIDTLIVPEFSDFTLIELDTGTAWIDKALRPLYAHLDNKILRPKYAQDKEHPTVTLKTIDNVSKALKTTFKGKNSIKLPYRYEDSLISISLQREDKGIAKLDYTIKERLLVNHIQVPCPEYIYGMKWWQKCFMYLGMFTFSMCVLAFFWGKIKRTFNFNKD